MSNVSLSDLMRELQAGEEARAKVPQLQSSNTDLMYQVEAAQRHSQELETSIMGYKNEIATQRQHIARLEVERDDAGFRALESDDKLHRLLVSIRGIQSDIGDAVVDVDPTVLYPTSSTTVQPTPVPVTEEPGGFEQMSPQSTPGESAADPIAPSTDGPSSGVQSPGANEPNAAPPSSDQSDANPPSAPSTAPTPSFASGNAVEQSPPAPSMKTEEYRPFEGQSSGGVDTKPNAGRAYWEKPNDMSWSDWQISGGSI